MVLLEGLVALGSLLLFGYLLIHKLKKRNPKLQKTLSFSKINPKESEFGNEELQKQWNRQEAIV